MPGEGLRSGGFDSDVRDAGRELFVEGFERCCERGRLDVDGMVELAGEALVAELVLCGRPEDDLREKKLGIEEGVSLTGED